MKAKNLEELRIEKNIKVGDISAVMSKTTYYNRINGKNQPKEALQIFLKLFDIDKKTFYTLLKSWRTVHDIINDTLDNFKFESETMLKRVKKEILEAIIDDYIKESDKWIEEYIKEYIRKNYPFN